MYNSFLVSVVLTGGLPDVVAPSAPVIAQQQRVLGPVVKVTSQVHLSPGYICISCYDYKELHLLIPNEK